MASINKLSIRGVRAFSPDESEQVINFSFPLTIIVGANGCGKTTIIESLKYAVTGQMPPGVKNGQAFVHDPRSAGQTSVKANIKLRFTNRAGNSMVVIRSMEVTQKKTTLTFKALDGILRTTNPETGERISMSHKCTELDRQIPTLIGVSKPILDHVVFCHQEDSSWPLMEGAVLKKRFDDIFDSTRYAKALEAIKKCRQEHHGNAKDHKADLEGLKSHKHAAMQFRQEMEETTEKMAEIQDLMADYDDKIKAEEEKIEKFSAILAEVNDLEEKRSAKQSEIERNKEIVQNTRNMLERDMTAESSVEGLEQMLSSVDGSAEEEALEEKEEERARLLRAIEDSRSEVGRLNNQRGRLSSEQEVQERALRGRLAKIERIASEFGIDLHDHSAAYMGSASAGPGSLSILSTMTAGTQGSSAGGMIVRATESSADSVDGGDLSMSDEEINRFTSFLQQRETSMKKELAQLKQRHKEGEDKLTTELSELQAKAMSIENEEKRFQNEQRNAAKELRTLNQQLHRSRVTKKDVEEAKRKAAAAAKNRNEAASNLRLKSIPKSIKDKERSLDDLQRDLDEDKELLRMLREQSEEQSTINMLQKQVDQERARLQELLDTFDSTLKKLQLDASADDYDSLANLVENIRTKIAGEKEELESARNTQSEKQKLFFEKSAHVEHSGRSLEQIKRKISSLNREDGGVQRINNVIHEVRKYETEKQGSSVVRPETKPQELLRHLDDTIREFSVEDDDPASIARTLKKLKKMAGRKDASGNVHAICPCCMRDMDPNEARTFVDRMEELRDPNTSEIIQTDRSLGDQKEMYERWRSVVAQGIHDWLEHSRLTNELDQTEEAINGAKQELSLLQASFEEAKEKSSDLHDKVTELQSFHTEARKLRDDGAQIEDKKRQIAHKKEDLEQAIPSSDGRDLKQVESDMNGRQDSKDRVMDEIKGLNREMSEKNNQITLATNKASYAEREAKEKEEAYAKDQEANVRKAALDETIKKCSEELRKLLQQKEPLNRQIKRKEGDRTIARNSATKREEKENSSLNRFSTSLRELESSNATIKRYQDANKGAELERLTSELEAIEARMKEKQAAAAEIDPDIELLRQKISEQDRRKKIIEDNIELLKKLSSINELEEELADLTEEWEGITGYDVAQQALDTAENRKKQLTESKAHKEGRKFGLKDQLKTLKRKLQLPEYKDVEERHRVKMIQYETTVLAVSDLDKYYVALDRALLRYHGMKIADINKIIRELWTLTYKGQDIYNIQLVSDGGSKASKSYNYRVVMTKGNTQMDMRGRCSAGQRVLASIVIRLALAETFCLNCGVMALDEPTTNLDEANKKGLAIALAQIIAARSAQHNFQLVVITHDVDFVSMMKQELSTQAGFDMPEKYFHVSREEGQDGKFYSKIHGIDWDEI